MPELPVVAFPIVEKPTVGLQHPDRFYYLVPLHRIIV
jgi:hypothetical protein